MIGGFSIKNSLAANKLTFLGASNISKLEEAKQLSTGTVHDQKSDLKYFVDYSTFMHVKYGIQTFNDLQSHVDATELANKVGSSMATFLRLYGDKQISNTLNEEVRTAILDAKDYLEYTNSSNIIILTVEKLFQVASKTFRGFKVAKQNFEILCYLSENGQDKELTLGELIDYVIAYFGRYNRIVTMKNNAQNLNSVMGTLLHNKFGKTTTSQQAAFIDSVTANVAPFDVPDYFTTDEIDLLVNSIIDVHEPKKAVIGPAENPIVLWDIAVNSNNIHELDTLINTRLTYLPEVESLVSVLVEEALVSGDDANAVITQIADVSTISTKEYSELLLTSDIYPLNPGLLNEPTKIKTKQDAEKREYATKLVNKLSSELYSFIYCPLTYDYLLVRDKRGLNFNNLLHLNSFLTILKKTFYYLNHVGVFYSKDKDKALAHMLEVINRLSTVLGEHDNYYIQRMYSILSLNFNVWTRTVILHDFGEIKSKYLLKNLKFNFRNSLPSESEGDRPPPLVDEPITRRESRMRPKNLI